MEDVDRLTVNFDGVRSLFRAQGFIIGVLITLVVYVVLSYLR